MKKCILIIILVLFICSGCFNVKQLKNVNRDTNNEENKDLVFEKEFGSYSISNTWEENVEHSTNRKFFYIKKGDTNNPPNNISIESGINRYGENDHMMFKDAILRQLAMQTKSSVDQIKASGSNTSNNYVMYTFILDSGINVTKQYYIVGDYKYVLVHATIFDRDSEEEVNNISSQIVNSFKWK